TWFTALGIGRAKTLGNSETGTINGILFSLTTVGISLFGDTVLRKHGPVDYERRRIDLLKRRRKPRLKEVKDARGKIITIEHFGFAHDELREKFLAEHRISRDHAQYDHQHKRCKNCGHDDE